MVCSVSCSTVIAFYVYAADIFTCIMRHLSLSVPSCTDVLQNVTKTLCVGI